jgi:predicted lipid-binding transport protein (Tim44 family)
MTDGFAGSVLDAVVIIGLSVVVSLIILWLVRLVVSHEQLKPHNEVSGFVYAVIGVIYAVLLGFAVISVWEEYQEAEDNANAEANAIGDIYRIAAGLPDAARPSIQEPALAYSSAVIDAEWPAMRRGEAPSAEAVEQLDALWDAFYQVDVATQREEGLYAAGLSEMDELSDHRRQRIVQSDEGMLGIMWGVLIGGAILTVLFPCLFGVENGLVHSLIICTLAMTLGLLLYLVYDLNHPFQGDVHVQPDGFTLVLEQLSQPD